MFCITYLILIFDYDYVAEFDCSTAKENVKDNYVKLTNLPINLMINQLYSKGVITDEEKLKIEALSLEIDRMKYFLDHILLPSLKNDVAIKFKGFLEVMEESDNSILTSMAKMLGMYASMYVNDVIVLYTITTEYDYIGKPIGITKSGHVCTIRVNVGMHEHIE